MLGTGIAKKIGLERFIPWILNCKKSITVRKKIKRNRKLTQQRNKTKIFSIGFNKTGTTTIEKALSEFDLIMGHQRTAEKLMDKIMKNDYGSLIEYCKTGEAFQDVPFSNPGVYKILDAHFPNSKYILTIRDSDEQWFNSITKFHSKLWGGGKLPTRENLANANYVYKGYPLKVIEFKYGKDLYNKENYIQLYNKHIEDVQDYFKDRPNDLIVINVAKNEDYKKLCEFLNQKPIHDSFSWENKTEEL